MNYSQYVTPRNVELFSRTSLFLVYFWFGILKVLSLSPADDLVYSLHEMTLSFVPFKLFFVSFGIFEMLLGISFLLVRYTKYIIPVMMLHMATTMLPLLILPDLTWDGWFVPNLTGQYILKNLILISLGLNLLVNSGELISRRADK